MYLDNLENLFNPRDNVVLTYLISIPNTTNQYVLDMIGCGLTFLMAYKAESGSASDGIFGPMSFDQAQYHIGDILFDNIGNIPEYDQIYDECCLKLKEVVCREYANLEAFVDSSTGITELTYNYFPNHIQLIIMESSNPNPDSSYSEAQRQIDNYHEFMQYVDVFERTENDFRSI